MQIFGYAVDRRFRGLRLTPSPLDEPWFSKGSETGCLVLHGIGGTPANVRVTADGLAKQGYTVYAPLLAGHGRTLNDLHLSTWRDWCRTVEEGLARLKAAGCSRLYVIGLSLGGLLSGLAAERNDLSGCVMICPPVAMRHYLQISALLSPLFPFAAYGDHEKRDAYANMLAGMATEKLRDILVLSKLFRRRMERITCPLLMIEAGRDDKVAPRSFRYVREGAVNAAFQLRRYPKAPHGCTYEIKTREEIARAVLAFVREQEEGKQNPE